MFDRFLEANVRLSRWFASALGLESDKPLWSAFEQSAAAELRRLPAGSTVLDLGGGRRCVYAAALANRPPLRVIAVDVSPEELALNTDVSETCVADISARLPFPDASADLVLSRTALEHVNGVPAAVQEIARTLRPGARTLHLVPCRYALFALAARLLSFRQLLALLHVVNPAARSQIEFDVVYDHCYPKAMYSLFREAGFRDVSITVTYAQPGYFEPLFPVFLVTSLYEYVVRRLRLTSLSSYMFISAVR